jgi:hypothetical protein
MKKKYILVSLLLVALVMGGTGYSVSAGSMPKITGGGSFVNDLFGPYQGDKISFKLNTMFSGQGAAGQFQLINHDAKTKLQGSFSEYNLGTWIDLYGTCSIDGEGPHTLKLRLVDRGSSVYDIIYVYIDGSMTYHGGRDSNGNITVKEK